MSEITKILQAKHGEQYILDYAEVFCEQFMLRLHNFKTINCSEEDWLLKLGHLLVDNNPEMVEKSLKKW